MLEYTFGIYPLFKPGFNKVFGCNSNCHEWLNLRVANAISYLNMPLSDFVAYLNIPLGNMQTGFEYTFVIYSNQVWINPNISFGLAWKPAQAFTQLLLKVSTTVMLVHCWLHTTLVQAQCHVLMDIGQLNTIRLNLKEGSVLNIFWFVPPGVISKECWFTDGIHMLVNVTSWQVDETDNSENNPETVHDLVPPSLILILVLCWFTVGYTHL